MIGQFYPEEYRALFALENLFERAATDAQLSDFTKARHLCNAVDQMHEIVLCAFAEDPTKGRHLAEFVTFFLEQELTQGCDMSMIFGASVDPFLRQATEQRIHQVQDKLEESLPIFQWVWPY